MTALAQGTAGLALVMAFALLCIGQLRGASILLATQSAAVAVSAVAVQQPLIAAPPLLLAAIIWFVPPRAATLEPQTEPLGGAKLAIGAGAALAVICQSQGGLAVPLAVVLLSVLLAATRRHPLMHIMALVGIQNGAVLAACLVTHHGMMPVAFLAVACFLLPLPLAAGLLVPRLTGLHGKAVPWVGWIDLGLAVTIFAATLLVPLDLTASVFAPLLGLDGIIRSWQRRTRPAMSPASRGLAILTSAFLVLAVCPAAPVAAWLAVLAAVMTSLLPTLPRLWNNAVLAFLGAGVAVFGLLALGGLLTPGSFIPGFLAIFAGFAAIAAIVPDLAVVLVILLLRLAEQAPWPPAAEALGVTLSLIALLTCAARLPGTSPRSAVRLLQQSQASIAAASICLGHTDGRFAALVLLILLILTRSAARVSDRAVASLAIAGLGGVPPLGVFPGLVLVVLAMINHSAWLLLPLGAAAIPILIASLPKGVPVDVPEGLPSRPPAFALRAAVPSVGWLPLALTLLTGYFALDVLLRWWHMLTAGQG